MYTDEIREWAQHTDGGFKLIEVDGDHWFLDRNRELIIATLQDIAAEFQRNGRRTASLPAVSTDRDGCGKGKRSLTMSSIHGRQSTNVARKTQE